MNNVEYDGSTFWRYKIDLSRFQLFADFDRTVTHRQAELCLPKNGIVFVAGRNGAGKSQFLNFLFQEFAQQYQLSPFFQTQSPYQQFIFKNAQREYLFPFENANIDEKDASKKSQQFFQSMDLAGDVQNTKLSHGQSQWLIFDSLTSTGNEVYFFDEVSRSLSSHLNQEFENKLTQLAQFHLVFLVSHQAFENLNHIKAYNALVDKVIWIDNGQVSLQNCDQLCSADALELSTQVNKWNLNLAQFDLKQNIENLQDKDLSLRLEISPKISLDLTLGDILFVGGINGIGKTFLLKKWRDHFLTKRKVFYCGDREDHYFLSGKIDDYLDPQSLNQLQESLGLCFTSPSDFEFDELSPGVKKWIYLLWMSRMATRSVFDLYIFDEPYLHLDRFNYQKFLEFLMQLRKYAIVIVSGHDEMLEAISNQKIMLNEFNYPKERL